MNCLTPYDAVCNTLDAIQKEFIGYLDHYINHYGEEAADILLKPLEVTPWTWMQSTEYREMKFEFDAARDTLETIYNNFQRFFGQSAAFEFIHELTHQVYETVKGRIEFWREKEVEEAQLIFNWELKQSIEERKAV